MPEDIALIEPEDVVLEWFYDRQEYAYGFDPVAADLNLDRGAVRAACRRLRSLGLLEFHRGLLTDEGDVAGSGYGISSAGWLWLHRQMEAGAWGAA